MIEFSPQSIQALELAARLAEARDLIGWWSEFAAIIGPPPPQALVEQIYAQAEMDAGALGIEDNDDHRIYLQAVATRLMPAMDARRYLLSTDAIFRMATDAERVAELVAIARGTA